MAPLHGGFAWLEGIADPVRLHILRSLSFVGEATASGLASGGHISIHTLRRHLEALVALGLVQEQARAKLDASPGPPAARFSLADEIRDSVLLICGGR